MESIYCQAGRILCRGVVLPLLLCSLPAGATRLPRIVNGVSTSEYPTVGSLVFLGGGSDPYHEQGCTGTLIGCETFLTAAHCVIDEPGPSGYLVFLPHAGFFSVSSTETDPSYNANGDATGDIAVLRLSTPVTGIAPTRINTDAAVGAGTAGTLVGYGGTSGNAEDFGMKRTGDVETASCPANVTAEATSVCWIFDNPLGPAGTDSNTCFGDSGGPLFVNDAEGLLVAGVTSFGTNDLCLAQDISADASVFASQTFITSIGGSDLDSQSCGDLPQVGDADTSTFFVESQINGGADSRHSFEVPDGSAQLRIALNGEQPFSQPEFDLFIKAGSAPTTSDFDCTSQRSGLWQFCQISGPQAGTWYVLIAPRGSNDSAAYQLTATMLGGEMPPPVDACGVAPASGCRTAEKSLLLLKQRGGNDKLIWKWGSGQATSQGEFADPTVSTSYDLCLYAGTTPALVAEAEIPAGLPGWSALGSKGYKYKDSTASQSGMQTVLLKGSDSDKAKVLVKGKGPNLPDPSLPLALPLSVQLVNRDSGLCWQSSFLTGDVKKNEVGQFKAKGSN